MTTYTIILEGNKTKEVEGRPVKIMKGIDTFIHDGDNPKRYTKGFVVSEVRTGRYVGYGEKEKEAISHAKDTIALHGEEETRRRIELLDRASL